MPDRKASSLLDLTPEAASRMAAWSERFIAAGQAGLRGSALEDPTLVSTTSIEAFRDGLGQRHASHVALLMRLYGLERPSSPPEWASPDAPLWACLLSDVPPRTGTFSDEAGPLWPDRVSEGIEAWTLLELRGLHALWWCALTQTDRHLAERALSAARWHVRELQPDNSTNRPWGIHVFCVLASIESESGADMHLQTLFHNALITGGGVPEVVSAAILLDAAQAISATTTSDS